MVWLWLDHHNESRWCSLSDSNIWRTASKWAWLSSSRKPKIEKCILCNHLVFFLLRVQDTKDFLKRRWPILRQVSERCQIVQSRLDGMPHIKFKVRCNLTPWMPISFKNELASMVSTSVAGLLDQSTQHQSGGTGANACLWTTHQRNIGPVIELTWLLHFWSEEFIFHIGTDNWRCSLLDGG